MILPVCNYDSLTLENRLAKALDLSKEQKAVVDQAMAVAFDALSKMEVGRASLKTTPQGDQAFVVEPFDGKQIFANLESSLRSKLDGPTTDLLMGIFSVSPSFGRFGSHRQEIWVEGGNASVGGTTIRPITLGVVLSDSKGNPVGFNGTTTISPEVYKARYGNLISRLAPETVGK